MATDPQDDRSPATPSRPPFSLGRPLVRRGRGAARHPDVELLDALAGGEPVTRSAREHIDACPACRESVAALRRVRSELSRLTSLTMPGDVAERIQATLAIRLHTTAARATEPEGPSQPADPSRTATSAPHPAVSPSGTQHPAAQHPAAHRSAADLPAAWVPLPAPLSDAPDPAPGRPGLVSVDPAGPADATDPAGPAGPAGKPSGPVDVSGHLMRAGTGTRGRLPLARPTPIRRGPKRSQRRPLAGRSPGRGAGLWNPASGRRDWVSIAAVCIAFLTFGTALFALHDLRGGSDPTLPEARAASEPGTETRSAVPMTMVADSRMAVVPTNIVRHGETLLDGRITGSVGLAMGLSGMPVGGAVAQTAPSGTSQQALGILRSQPAARAPGAGTTGVRALSTTTASRLRALLDTPDLRTCYQSLLAQTGGFILGIDLVRYNGQAALLVVLSVPSQPSVGRLVVVDAGCGMTSSSTAPLYSVIAKRE
ncbi:hypothetical protein [Frankia sp. R82]|uniref:hypothetical protein n=1 Tax=Frankia sp. R82 TaxID=2950553 RepID=UPI0020440B97|nr:hypothetical protein [Frankia sp. R82]MCM3887309.1 hypothetical protein [Frankia sp. R82]